MKDRTIGIIFAIVIALALWVGSYAIINDGAEQQRLVDIAKHERMMRVCPSLLSIARSSRDTLIVMKNESLCVTFVLDSLK